MSSRGRFKPYRPDVQAVARLEEALPPEHPVHVFVDRVRSVDRGYFVIPPGPKGEQPYHPHALFGILAWGYLHGVRSARKLARLARQEATFVYLAGRGRPNYRTLARFRRDNTAAFTAVFQETVILSLRVGLARPGHVALDGPKLKASPSKHEAMSSGRMRQREAQLRDEIAGWWSRPRPGTRSRIGRMGSTRTATRWPRSWRGAGPGWRRFGPPVSAWRRAARRARAVGRWRARDR